MPIARGVYHLKIKAYNHINNTSKIIILALAHNNIRFNLQLRFQ